MVDVTPSVVDIFCSASGNAADADEGDPFGGPPGPPLESQLRCAKLKRECRQLDGVSYGCQQIGCEVLQVQDYRHYEVSEQG